MKTYLIIKTVVYKYNIEARNKKEALDLMSEGYDFWDVYIKSIVFKIKKP